MFKTLNAVNTLLGTVLALAVITLLGAGGWLGYRSYHDGRSALEDAEATVAMQDAELAGLNEDLKEQNERIVELNEDLRQKARQIEQLKMAMRLLKVDHRVAQIDVVGQRGSAEAGNLVTMFQFVEVDREGRPLEKPRVFEIKGDIVYVESWVVKFTDEYVEMGDPLRSTSLCLFRRVFGEAQQPAEGFPLDPVGSRPAAYRGSSKMSEMEREIWAKFWQYANDPQLAQKVGVRAAHGEAPFQKLVPGKRYKVLLRSSGGLTFAPEDLPPDARTGTPGQTF